MSNGSSRAGSSAIDAIEDPFLRRSVKGALHLRRYMPFYVFGLVWVLTLALFPSIRGGGSDVNASGPAYAGDASGVSAGAAGTTGATDTTAVDPNAAAATPGAATASGGAATPGAAKPGAAKPGATAGAAAGATNTAAPISAAEAQSAIQRGTGTDRLGAACTADLRQIPSSSYAIPCQNAYNGANGGATFRGVTDKEITIVYRKFPDSANSKAVDQVNQQAGYASADTTTAVRMAYIDYFNKAFELYGRKVKWVVYESENGNSTDEVQSKGKEGACLDADKIQKELKAFAVMGGGTQPFSECAAERGVPVFGASAYFPESYMRKYQPYMWNTVMECERISYQVAEYIGKRLLNKPAQWAGDAVMQKKTRYFGTYVPDNDGYQSCVAITKKELKSKYGVTDTGPQYNYQLDISRFPDQAAQASVQFSAAGVTTVILACDYISTTVLTAAAARQNWHPEWFQIGTAANDVDNSARLFEQSEVNGHLFGPSQLGSTNKLIGESSEPGHVYKDATGKAIPDGTSGDYFTLVMMYNLLQSAGPNLTPAALGKGAMTIPPGGAPDFPAGYWSFVDGPDGTPGAGDHTTIDDSREIYWVSQNCGTTCTNTASDPYYNGPDGKNGTYKETYGGKRFRNGEWPKEDPPIYPPH